MFIECGENNNQAPSRSDFRKSLLTELGRPASAQSYKHCAPNVAGRVATNESSAGRKISHLF